MKYILLILLLIFISSCSEENQKSNTNINTNVKTDKLEHKNLIQKANKIEYLINKYIDSTNTFVQNQNLEINIYTSHFASKYIGRTNLMCDSIFILLGNLYWDFKSIKFNFKADTTDLYVKNEIEKIWKYNKTKEKNINLYSSSIDISEEKLQRMSKIYSQPTWRKFFRMFLKEMSWEDLHPYQTVLNTMNQMQDNSYENDFVTLIMNYGYYIDTEQSTDSIVLTLERMKLMNKLLLEESVNLNFDEELIEKIKAANNI